MHYPDEKFTTPMQQLKKCFKTAIILPLILGSWRAAFKKPILTYWAVLAGFQTLGYTFCFAAFFLIAGAADL